MRLRNIKGAAKLIEENKQIIIPSPSDYKGKWKTLFNNENPIHIEIGMGKGKFIYELANKNPDINYIGIEKFDSVIVRALEKSADNNLDNLLLIRMDANLLSEVFDKSEISRIYLNFSDPWPKVRHAKRRLTHENFLKIYEEILNEDGEIFFKTDNMGLFEYSIKSINNYGMIICNISLDLHNSNFEGNIMTEFEEKFSEQGQRIYRLESKYRR